MEKQQIIKDLTKDELKEKLIEGFSLVGILFKEDSRRLENIAIDTVKYNGNLYVKTLHDLFSWYGGGCLPETEKKYPPEPSAMFITRMRMEFFRNPSRPEDLRRKHDREMEEYYLRQEQEEARLNKKTSETQ